MALISSIPLFYGAPLFPGSEGGSNSSPKKNCALASRLLGRSGGGTCPPNQRPKPPTQKMRQKSCDTFLGRVGTGTSSHFLCFQIFPKLLNLPAKKQSSPVDSPPRRQMHIIDSLSFPSSSSSSLNVFHTREFSDAHAKKKISQEKSLPSAPLRLFLPEKIARKSDGRRERFPPSVSLFSLPFEESLQEEKHFTCFYLGTALKGGESCCCLFRSKQVNRNRDDFVRHCST